LTYANLNGLWEFQPAVPGAAPPFGQTLNASVLVPFPVEACLSGVGVTHMYLWYRLVFDRPAGFSASGVTLLHFGAVDWQTTVYVNGINATTHTGGYDPFTVDVTSLLVDTGNELIVVRMGRGGRGRTPGAVTWAGSQSMPQRSWRQEECRNQ
jgi:beta-galactosidase/beta-glucuronidase